MQKQDRPLVPNVQKATLREEREEERRTRERAEDKERHEDFNEGLRAINSGESFSSHKGRRLRGFGRNPSIAALSPHLHNRSISYDMNIAAAISLGALASNLHSASLVLKNIFASVGVNAPAAPVIANPTVEDSLYSYGQIKVCRATSDQLSKEMAKVSGLSEQMACLDDKIDPNAPWIENNLWAHRKALMDEFGMRALPNSYEVAHNAERVIELEFVFNPYAIAQDHTVMAYTPRLTGNDTLGYTVEVGDPNANDGQDIVASGDHLKVAPQVPPMRPADFRLP
jgi:hypothetical protein